VHRRVDLLTAEGVVFKTNADVRKGGSVDPQELESAHDAVVLTVGATKPRDLPVPGRELKGVHFAMEFLTKNQKDLSFDSKGDIKNQWGAGLINAQGKRVIVIGGGDTGTDCIGTSLRHYCKSVVNLEVRLKYFCRCRV
jgi:glutamate synthase (NADPH/NADH) small chain